MCKFWLKKLVIKYLDLTSYCPEIDINHSAG